MSTKISRYTYHRALNESTGSEYDIRIMRNMDEKFVICRHESSGYRDVGQAPFPTLAAAIRYADQMANLGGFDA